MTTKFSYIGSDDKIPAQSFNNNKGIFDLDDVYSLDLDNKWTNYGQLELLAKTTVSSSTSTVDFLNLDSYGNFKFFMMTLSNISIENNNKLIGMEFLSNGVASSVNYQVLGLVAQANGTFQDVKGTSYPALRLTDNVGSATNEVVNSLFYIYNNLDSQSYSYITYHGLFQTEANVQGSEVGSGCLPDYRFDNGLRFHPDQNGSTNFLGGKFALYGVRSYE